MPTSTVLTEELKGPQSFPAPYEVTNVFGIAQVAPAAGADVAITVPFGVAWDVKALTAKLTTSATVANRSPGFVVKAQDGTVVYTYQTTATLAASLNLTITFSEDVASVPTAIATTNQLVFPMPKTWVMPGWTFGTTTLNIQAADQWSNVGVWVEEHLPPCGQ